MESYSEQKEKILKVIKRYSNKSFSENESPKKVKNNLKRLRKARNHLIRINEEYKEDTETEEDYDCNCSGKGYPKSNILGFMVIFGLL